MLPTPSSMFSFLAWPRVFTFLFLFLFLTPYVASREDSLFTSSVTYCEPPETLLVQRFEVAFFPSNSSVNFNVSVSSVQPNVNVTANVLLNVYGMKPVNLTVNLCNLLKGALCPLPMYNFTGADSITLPSSLGVLQKIPKIAYKIPDLEGFAQLTLTEEHTGNVKACVQATLSNGRSAHQRAVEWTTGGVALAGLLLAIWQSSISPEFTIPFRLLELIYLFQSIASSSFLSLNYPSVYRAFALNFAWAMGLISAGPNSSLQKSINNMRHLTGGNLADAIDGPAVGLVNRKLSPFNDLVGSMLTLTRRDILQSSPDVSSKFAADFANLASPHPISNLVARDTIVNGVVQTVTSASSNILQAGVPIYVNTLHIATANAFMTVFICALSMFGIAMVAFALGYGINHMLKKRRKTTIIKILLNFDYNSFVISWFIRLSLVSSFPIFVFAFYQWTLKDSWLSVFLSVLALIFISLSIVYPSLLTLRFARKGYTSALYAPNAPILARAGPLYAQYRALRYNFFLPILAATFLRAIFISFAKSSAEAQLALLIVVEFGLVVLHFALKPAKTKGGDVFGTYLTITRMVCTALMIAFLENLKLMAIPRVVIGIVIALAWSVAVVVVIGNLVWNTIVGLRFRRDTHPPSILGSPHGSEGSMLEKGIRADGSATSNGSKTKLDEKALRRSDSGVSLAYSEVEGGAAASDMIEEVARTRPLNPTPENNAPFDPYLLTAFPISPTTTVTTMDPPSLYSRDSGTITVGSLLPRRWSFSMSQPGSPAGSSFGHGYQTQLNSSNPSPVPPSSPSDGTHSSVLSRNTSLRAQQQHQHQLRHEDIEEEDEGLPSPPTTLTRIAP